MSYIFLLDTIQLRNTLAADVQKSKIATLTQGEIFMMKRAHRRKKSKTIRLDATCLAMIEIIMQKRGETFSETTRYLIKQAYFTLEGIHPASPKPTSNKGE